jgi:hypothetical protein
MAHAGGRPPAFESPEELQKLVDDYFESLKVYNAEGDHIDTRPALVTGIALHLGFCTRQSFYDYEKKPKFTYTIKKARLRVESSYENQLFGKSTAGAIFGLKNVGGWSDKQEIESKVEVTGQPLISFSDTSKKEDS